RPAYTFDGIDIFVSHSARDEDLAQKVTDLLRTALNLRAAQIRCTSVAGYRLHAGAKASEVLRDDIEHCRVFLAILTEASAASQYVAAEIGARWLTRGTAIMLRGGGFEPSDVRGPLADTHSIDLRLETDLHQLIGEVALRLDVQAERADL